MEQASPGTSGHRIPWRIFGWSIPIVLLLLPLVANAPWTLSDYIVMGILFGLVGLGIELTVRASRDPAYRAGAGVAVVTAFLLIWVNAAVGFLGDESNPANLMFIAVIGVALVGAFLALFRARGMARAMLAAAMTQIAVGIVALVAGVASPGNDGLYEVVMGTTMFGGLWLLSSWLFAVAARRQQLAANGTPS